MNIYYKYVLMYILYLRIKVRICRSYFLYKRAKCIEMQTIIFIRPCVLDAHTRILELCIVTKYYYYYKTQYALVYYVQRINTLSLIHIVTNTIDLLLCITHQKIIFYEYYVFILLLFLQSNDLQDACYNSFFSSGVLSKLQCKFVNLQSRNSMWLRN